MSIHTCSYYCDRPECIRAQRDELRQKLEQAEMVEKGTKAWADTPDDWVDDLRGGAEEQEPVAWMWKDGTLTADPDYADGTWTPLYAAPVHAIDISQERVDETAKDRHEFECPRCGHCCQQREWVGFNAAELEKIIPMLVKSFINHDEKTLFLLVGAMLVDIEDQLKSKNGYGLEIYAQPTDFIGPSVVEAISNREWVGLTD